MFLIISVGTEYIPIYIILPIDPSFYVKYYILYDGNSSQYISINIL